LINNWQITDNNFENYVTEYGLPGDPAPQRIKAQHRRPRRPEAAPTLGVRRAALQAPT
jgi:hypothetical protein